ncbi:hypothetical protein CS063_05190 [Sporanaerobium hydrogeniformans]|uniref:Uncharacterized protein n=1 Tax=Sporanaerobium hydrogeniformans TaxID=3072179 RepID=A0AC61DE60_9FIRM|nr:HDIG domain-containing metalloprotein [Sporanaerobium hydrogeniformans]PHV71445.1 hypothetical protein CS063_05190 [Sporanaerobium hydrogeniformans]
MTIALCTTFFSVITGNFFAKRVSIQVGQIASESYYAPFLVENEIATERKRALQEKSVEPVYKSDIKVQEKAISDMETLFNFTQTIQTTDIAERLNKTPLEALKARAPVALYNEEFENLLATSQMELAAIKETCIALAAELFQAGIQENDNKEAEIRSLLSQSTLSMAHQRLAKSIILSVIKPNVILDEIATEEAKKLEREKVEAICILPGEIIVEKGKLVTEEIYTLLEKVGYLDTNKNDRYKQYAGVLLLIAFVVYFWTIYTNKSGLDSKLLPVKEINLLLILYSVSIMMVRVLVKAPFVYIPLSIAPMLVAVLMGIPVAIVLNIILTLFSALVLKSDSISIIYFVLTGIIDILIISHMQERKKTMVSALFVGGIQFGAYMALKLFIGTDMTMSIGVEASIAFVIGVISVVLVVGSLPVLESAFGYITPMQLLELTNPNQPILKRLLLEATGTYYHSLLVANLAEAAASVIGANPLLARVGGYYHDIGKLTCSNYFKENQVLGNPHDQMDPFKSYEVISSHVTSGVKLANEYRLPSYIKDMITQHHGTGLMQFFYVKAKKEKGDLIKEEQFSYKGPKPKTKEAALVMLADVVEATVRAMQEKLGADLTIEQLVRKMVKQKLDEGQLDECELYISDIEKIIQSFTKMLKGMYHERVQYPERDEK